MTPVTAARLEKAHAVLGTAQREMSQNEFFELLSDLGWFDAASFNDMGQLQLELEDIQVVGLAAACVAFLELNGRWT